MRSVRGQGTVEYLAVVLLVVLVLGGGTAAVASSAGADVATAVPHQVIRALCIVTRGDCDRDRAPCDIGSTADARSWTATIAVVRLGHGRVLVRERRSDHSVLVTLTTIPSAGAQITTGARARFDRGRRRLSVGGAVTASLIAELGHGQAWVLPSDRAADELVAALKRGDDVRPADQDLRQVNLVPGATASRPAGASLAGGTGNATVTAHGSIGRSTDHRTGGRTYFIEGGADAVLDLSAHLGTLRASASADGAASARIALSMDGTGRWVDLALVGSGEVAGKVSLPPSAAPIAEALNVPSSGGRRWVAEAHLDLNDAGNLAAAKVLVARLGAVPPRPVAVRAAAAELARRIDERGVVDLRTYELDRTADGFEVQTGGPQAVGIGHEHTTENTRLIAATTRGLDGQWRRRIDCLKEVHA